MKTIKVSEATSLQIDWLVAKCEERHITLFTDQVMVGDIDKSGIHWFNPSTNWAQGGPIIEWEGIEVVRGNDLYFPKGNEKGDHYESLWIAKLPLMDLPQGYRFHGPTALIAAMRCYVASKLGDEVEVPDQLGKT